MIDLSAYCGATRGDDGCPNLASRESNLCGGHEAQLYAFINAVPSLIDYVRSNRMPGQRGGGEKVSGTKERPAPVNLSAVDDADAMFALVMRYAEWIAEQHNMAGSELSKLPAWRVGAAVAGLRPDQGSEEARRCTRYIAAQFDWVISQDWAGVIADEFRAIVGPPQARWQTEERPTRQRCPRCRLLVMTKMAPSVVGADITYEHDPRYPCDLQAARLGEDDYWVRYYVMHQQIAAEQKIAEIAAEATA